MLLGKYFLITAFSINLLVVAIDDDCPMLTICVCETTFSICKIPAILSFPAASIAPPRIDLNVAEVLPGGVLPPNITWINLYNSPIKSISEDAFDDSALTLTKFILANSSITRIPDVLLHLHALTYVNITDTKILDWNPNVLSTIGPSVSWLCLSNVGLTIWPSWMKSFTNVSSFIFTRSQVSSIPDDAFEVMDQLIILTLNDNRLSTVPKVFRGFTEVTFLDLSNNLIKDITWLPNTTWLFSLSLGGNRLSNSTHISHVLLPHAKSLNELDLHGNLLTSIPDLHFLTQFYRLNLSGNLLSNTEPVTFPPKLNELDLTSNLFPLIPNSMSTLQSMPTLSLSSNKITTIKSTNFASGMEYVQLDKNLITELTNTSFPEFSIISSLVLDYNPIAIISPSAFTNFKWLTYLSLQYTYLARLPMALASLRDLETLDMSGNRYLVCTCMEKDLARWVLSSMSEWSIHGNCGQTSIYNFFKTLSPDCPAM